VLESSILRNTQELFSNR
jgi:acyl-homoserine lactone acylase PvdQ